MKGKFFAIDWGVVFGVLLILAFIAQTGEKSKL